jgi:hypothetical protein
LMSEHGGFGLLLRRPDLCPVWGLGRGFGARQ